MPEMIKLTSAIDGFEFDAWYGAPTGPRKGGLVLIQEIFGLDHYMIEDAKRWVAEGYEVIVPSMFDRQERGFVADHDARGFETGRQYAGDNGIENPVSDVQACVDALKQNGSVFLIGYCYGGTVAWRAAAQISDLSAAVSYYGGGVAGIADVALKCPVICNFGRKDAHIPADDVTATIKKAHPEVPVYIYENSGHGFNNDGRPDSDPADAKLARARSAALFVACGAVI
ncbi:dienelactone hydrolase family protein [Thalassospira sp. MCCC 1A01428]|uniref:dienelactone hydrolase family protein n=1 Tax=Thalassospira sp. MCCC 1A01428 TaxID=1470575 RepID=UPI000A1F60AA|nr:dienelactone hydrolase family protein [Thalassospira sp. MCCC 1A01428]OSQ43918.1 dienelactone hydrolase [Thalassospira sp. MCCC 1A01428]